MTLSAIEVNQLKQAQSIEGILPAVVSRWSPRSFAQREVSAEELIKVFEAARWSASSFNEQPWRFLVGRRGSETHQKISSALSDQNRYWAASAPVLILGAACATFSHNGSPNHYAFYDLGAAASVLTLQASALGIRTHSMAGFDHDAARRIFGIPEGYLLGAVIALGYQGEPEALNHPKLISLEVEPRTRKPLSEIVLSAWDTPSKLTAAKA
jgi:nitroreductase